MWARSLGRLLAPMPCIPEIPSPIAASAPDDRKDPAQPHPDDELPDPTANPPTPPAEQRHRTTVTRPRGYTPHASSIIPAPGSSASRPSLPSILKRKATSPPPAASAQNQSPSTPPTTNSANTDTGEIETADAVRAAPDQQFVIAIKKEVHSLISETKTFQPLTKTAAGYAENVDQKCVWKIWITLKCKRKKKPNGQQPDKHKARAAARADTLRRAMIKAQVPLSYHHAPHILTILPTCRDPETSRKLWTSNQFI